MLAATSLVVSRVLAALSLFVLPMGGSLMAS
ncbi:hypothetical protein EES42_35935 [Streptomyces sp. ADI95-17]|nr:hypothetical protein EES42_35935 [Streptomyces sp. ADI95-17]